MRYKDRRRERASWQKIRFIGKGLFSVVKCYILWGNVALIFGGLVLEKIVWEDLKNGTYLNICIETPIYERLEALCEDAG